MSSACSPLVKLVLEPTQTEWGSSRWAEVHRCRRAQWLKYVVGIERVSRDEELESIEDDDSPEPAAPSPRSDYFGVGILTHACLAYVGKVVEAGHEGLAKGWPEVIAAAANGSAGRTFAPEVCWETERLVNGYYVKWGYENAGWPLGAEIIAVEKYLEAPADWGFRYTTRADMILRLPGGEIAIPDHKTRGNAVPGAPTKKNPYGDSAKRAFYARALATRPQFLGLAALVQHAYALSSPPSIWYDAIVKTANPDYERVFVPVRQDQVDAWIDTQRKTPESDFRLNLPNYSQCAPEIGFLKPCWLFDYCHGTESVRAQRFRVRDAAEKE